jgi:hypothetical protein
MKPILDVWYIRLPEGRILHAANTDVLREHLRTGRIPRQSTVRRSPEDEWTPLEWTQEFTDLLKELPPEPQPAQQQTPVTAPPGLLDSLREERVTTIASRLDPAHLHFPGVRKQIRELHTALDCALNRKKLTIIGTLALVFATAASLATIPASGVYLTSPWVLASLALAGLLLLAAASVFLVNLTYAELGQLRPSTWQEGRQDILKGTFRLFLAQGLLLGGFVSLLLLCRWLAPWLLSEGLPGWNTTGEVLATALAVCEQLLEIVLLPVAVCTLLLGPLFLIEECSVAGALKRWIGLLWTQTGRILLWECLAAGVGLVFLAPLALCLLPFLGIFDPQFLPTMRFLRVGLAGGLASLLLGFLVVSNVFIYLNLQYASNAGSRRSP